MDDMFIDDFVSGADAEEEALFIYLKRLKIMKTASFELRKWRSNSPSLRAYSPFEKPNLKPKIYKPMRVLSSWE